MKKDDRSIKKQLILDYKILNLSFPKYPYLSILESILILFESSLINTEVD